MKMPTYDEMAKKVITEIEIEGKTIEQWIHEIVKLQNSNTDNWIKTADKFPPEKEWVETNFGGDIKVNLEPGYKLEEVTWKDSSLWYLVRPMREDEKPETYKFYQSTDFKVFEGCITINEQEKSKMPKIKYRASANFDVETEIDIPDDKTDSLSV